jgi:hypothetical protein
MNVMAGSVADQHNQSRRHALDQMQGLQLLNKHRVVPGVGQLGERSMTGQLDVDVNAALPDGGLVLVTAPVVAPGINPALSVDSGVDLICRKGIAPFPSAREFLVNSADDRRRRGGLRKRE